MFLKIAQKDIKHLGYFCDKFWSLKHSKIAQSGHTVSQRWQKWMISFTSIKQNDLAACHFELNDRQMNETKRNCFKHREVIAQWFRLRLPFCGPALGSNPKHTVSVFPICNIENGTAFDIGMRKTTKRGRHWFYFKKTYKGLLESAFLCTFKYFYSLKLSTSTDALTG